MERWKLLTFWNYPISADIVECEDINILNNSESRGTSDEGFVMNLEQQPQVCLIVTHIIGIR